MQTNALGLPCLLDPFVTLTRDRTESPDALSFVDARIHLSILETNDAREIWRATNTVIKNNRHRMASVFNSLDPISKETQKGRGFEKENRNKFITFRKGKERVI